MTVPAESPTFDRVTVLSLLATLAVVLAAYALSLRLLPAHATRKTRTLFIWHLADALTHFFFEGSFLYHCFFVYRSIGDSASDSTSTPTPASTAASTTAASAWSAASPLILTPPDVFFLGRKDRAYGAGYGTGPFASLWQEYARADRRWGGADLTVVSLEILTVCGAGPLALWVADMVRRGETEEEEEEDDDVGKGRGRGRGRGRVWFWMVVLATGELYGGFMTFAPEWLCGSPNLDTSNFMYKWVYLFFFNTLWVWFPIWVMYEAYGAITGSRPEGHAVGRAGADKKTT